jgi:acyl-CoA thioesterase-2
MSNAVQELVSLLDLEQLELNLFRGITPPSPLPRVFGGQVIGQSLVSACRTTDLTDRLPHSLHAYFLLGGDPSVPIIYSVERIRDGKSFSTRRVTAIQHGQPILSMEVSFHRSEESFDHQAQMPDVPKPDQLPGEEMLRKMVLPELPEVVRKFYARKRPIELRPVEFERYLGKKITNAKFHVWFRAAGALPDDVAIHRCVLAYASDMMLLDTALVPHGTTVFSPSIMAASLDHALWIHRPFRADQWLLFAHDTPNLSGARGFVRGQVFSEDGTLVASVAQEGILRERRTDLGGEPVIPI